MRIERLGEGDPEVAVVGAIHGDEPCGARAVERLIEADPAVERPAALIVANEEALERGVRFVDADLNRSFDGGVGDTHEGRLARRLADELEGCTVLSLHSTQSHAEPFGLVAEVAGPTATIPPFLSIAALVDLDVTEEGRLFAIEADLIEVEAGLQGSDEAAENAHRIAGEFLAATGVLPGPVTGRDLPVYRLGPPVAKPPAAEYEVFAENFTRVDAGEAFAAADGEALRAEEPFHPILMSAHGYGDVFGYAGDRVGTLEAPERPRPERT